MTRRRFVAWVTVLALCASSGCRKKVGTTPDDVLDGAWTGAIVDSVSGRGDLELDLSQTYSSLTGTWSATFGSGAPSKSGTLGGTVLSSSVTLFLSPTTPTSCGPSGTLSGTLTVTATLIANRLAGSYVILTCTGASSGTIDVTR